MRKPLLFVAGLLVAVTLACGFNVSTANIKDAKIARDPDGNEPTTTFAQDDAFYLVAEVANAPDDTSVKVVWTAVEADGVDPNFVLGEKELTGGGQVNFSLENDNLWPVGRYKADLYLNGELDRTLEFSVEGEVAAQEPTATPEPEPTDTPEPEPTATPEPEDTPESSAGDSLSIKPATTEAPSGPEALAFQEEPYIHPSGAFSIAVPEMWEKVDEDKFSAAFGDNRSRVGVIFVNPGAVLNEEQMIQLIKNTMDIVVDSFAKDYEVASESNKLASDGYYYVNVSFNQGNGIADFFYEQQNTIVFILYFASLDYEQMDPTWAEIIGSYQIDPDAALAAAPPPATPTQAAPPPTPTPAPAANPLAPPPGVARVYLQNFYSNEYNIDFGDGSGSIHVMPGAENFYHDVPPGKYNPGLSLPGGGATNVQFEIQANEAWLIVVTEDLSVKWGKVYP